MARTVHTDCYLCGRTLSKPINRDHVPPRRFFAPEVRKKFKVTELITLPTHEACNEEWRLDEEYFVHTFIPFVRGSTGGDALYRDFQMRIARGDNVLLANQVLEEFQHVVGGVHLPANRVAKKVDAERVHDVVFKIIQAFKQVEVAVRKATKLPEDLVGQKLMRTAFNPENDKLTDLESPQGERQAVMELFSGAIGHGRNPPSHRDIDIERENAAQLIGFASYLLFLIDRIVAPRNE